VDINVYKLIFKIYNIDYLVLEILLSCLMLLNTQVWSYNKRLKRKIFLSILTDIEDLVQKDTYLDEKQS